MMSSNFSNVWESWWSCVRIYPSIWGAIIIPVWGFTPQVLESWLSPCEDISLNLGSHNDPCVRIYPSSWEAMMFPCEDIPFKLRSHDDPVWGYNLQVLEPWWSHVRIYPWSWGTMMIPCEDIPLKLGSHDDLVCPQVLGLRILLVKIFVCHLLNYVRSLRFILMIYSLNLFVFILL